MHAAERQLLRTAHQHEYALAVAGLSAAAERGRSAGLAAIDDRFAARRTMIAMLPAAERAAALSRLRDEQSVEVAAFTARMAASAASERRIVLGSLKVRQRAARGQLAERHRSERRGVVAGRMARRGRVRSLGVRVRFDRQRVAAVCARPKLVRERPAGQGPSRA